MLPFLERWFDNASLMGFPLPDDYGEIPGFDLDGDRIGEVFKAFVDRMEGCYPFHRPDYAGQMLKPPHPVAWLAYAMAMSVNTNNHALDGGPPTSEMEKEVVGWLAEMSGYDGNYLGHLTGGGTVANLEALWVAGKLHPGKKILYSADAHYTHERMCGVLGLASQAVPVTADGKMDVNALENLLDGAGTVVVTLGTTGRGVADPLDEILPLCRERGVRVHVDAAYGGFFRLVMDVFDDKRPWECIAEADSIVIDPHKHGLQPYGCGCVIFRDASVGRFYKHDSPYTYFTSKDLHLGEITLECSRPGASAAALWFTVQVLGLTPDSAFAESLLCGIRASKKLEERLLGSPHFDVLSKPETDILCYFVKGESTSEISSRSRKLFKKAMERDTNPVFLSLYRMPSITFTQIKPGVMADSDETVILRSVMMKPSHLGFVDEMVGRLDGLAAETRP